MFIYKLTAQGGAVLCYLKRKEVYLSYKSSRKGGRRISYAVKKIVTVFQARKSKLVFKKRINSNPNILLEVVKC